MRRLLPLWAACAVLAGACGDADTGGGVVRDAFDATPSSTSTTSSTSSTSTTTTPSSTSTTTSTSTTVPADDGWNPVVFLDVDEEDLCGDLVPVLVGSDQTCRDAESLPPAPVAPGTAWLLPGVEPGLADEYWWHEPLALFNWNTVSVLFVDDHAGRGTVEPLAVLDRWPDDVRIASDGTIVSNAPSDEDGDWIRYDVAVHRPDGSATHVLDDGEWLLDVAVVDGAESIVYEPDPGDGGAIPILVAPLTATDDARPAFGLAWDPDSDTRVYALDVHDDLAVVHGWRGDDEFIEVRSLDGAVLDVADPLSTSLFADRPEVSAIAWGPDGTRITWFESNVLEPQPSPLNRVSSMDVATGEIVFSIGIEEWLLSTQDNPVVSMFDLGDHVVVNVQGWWANRAWGEEALVVSFAADEPEAWRLPVTGIAVPMPYTVG